MVHTELYHNRYVTSSSSSLSHFYERPMWDDSRLHAARSFTSSPDSPFSLRSSFTAFTNPSSSVFLSFCVIALLYPSSSLSDFYVGPMWDDSRLHAARSYTSPDSPCSLRSSFTQSAHLFFGLPLLPFPCTSIPIALFPTYSSLLITCPYHRVLRSWTFFEISPA